eukprot:3826649-Prymnesium_polylepis.1
MKPWRSLCERKCSRTAGWLSAESTGCTSTTVPGSSGRHACRHDEGMGRVRGARAGSMVRGNSCQGEARACSMGRAGQGEGNSG